MNTNTGGRGTRVTAAILVVAALISTGILYSAYSSSRPTAMETLTSTSSSTVASTTMTTETLSGSNTIQGNCLVEVPTDAKIANFFNSTTVGNTVVFPNGTRSFYNADSCPQPVPPSIYEVASLIVSDPRFIMAENGSAYFLDVQGALYGGPLQDGLPNGTTLTYSELLFDHWGTPLDPLVKGCSGTPTPISELTTRYWEASEFQVGIPNLNVVYSNGLPQNLPNSTTGLDLSKMHIGVYNDTDDLNGFSCMAAYGG